MGPEVVDQRHGWRTEGTEAGEQVALDHVQHLGIAIMVDLVSKCRAHLFPETAGDLLPDIALSGQLERRGVLVPGPDQSVQYRLFARAPPQLVTGHPAGQGNPGVMVE